ncbi:MAG: hypothetical protein GX916_01735 [Clostridiales bacterium]|jgi:hypothetical protein|nr:hypothetical protein [Clostridiales bacterium]
MLKRLIVSLMFLALLPWPAPAETESTAQVSPEAAYFDDAVFVGDSVTNQIRRYRTAKRNEGEEIFGTARFLSAGAYSVYLGSLRNPPKDKVTLQYRGRAVSLSQGLAAMEAGKAFILLGLTDAPGRNVDRDMTRYARMIELIREASPDIQIVAMSVTPVMEKGQNILTKQTGINLFNERLQALCSELGITYLDVATPLKDEQGFLYGPYSSDKSVHLSEAGLEVLTETLHQHAREQLAGTTPTNGK